MEDQSVCYGCHSRIDMAVLFFGYAFCSEECIPAAWKLAAIGVGSLRIPQYKPKIRAWKAVR